MHAPLLSRRLLLCVIRSTTSRLLLVLFVVLLAASLNAGGFFLACGARKRGHRVGLSVTSLLLSFLRHHWGLTATGRLAAPPYLGTRQAKYPTMSSDDLGSAAAPKRVESDVYHRQIRLWGADAQVGVVLWFVSMC